MTINQIEAKIAELIKKETGYEVEVTCRDTDNWTISGYDAPSAAQWLQNNNLLTLTDTAEYDDDPGFTFCYMTSSK